MKSKLFQSTNSECSTIKKGQAFSIIEVLLAVAFFSLVVTSLVGGVIYGRQSTSISGYRQRAIMLADEAVEALKSIQGEHWSAIQYNQSAIELSGNEWVLSGEGTSESIEGVFTRFINFYDVCRDGSNIIVDCPGNYVDNNTKKAVVEVSWEIRTGMNYSVQLPIYLSNWYSSDWRQTDWSGGTGQSVWSDITKFLSGTNINYATTGEIKLSGGGGGVPTEDWTPKNGKTFTDRSDSDFSSGTFNNTTVSGSGDSAKVVLTSAMQWSEYYSAGQLTNRDFNCSDSLSDNSVWAGATSGEIYYFDGSSWSLQQDVGNRDINGIDMLSSSNGWAVGDHAEIYHYDGSWSKFTDLGNTNIFAIDMVSAYSGWAVGATGRIYYYNGSNWSQFTDTGSHEFRAINMVSSSDGWAVGTSGKIYHYNGSNWSQFTDTGSQTWYGIDMVSASDGWVVGTDGQIYHYNGSNWSQFTDTGSQTWYGIDMVSASDGWVVGTDGQIYHYDGSNWSQFTDTGSQIWYTVNFSSVNIGWTLGNSGQVFKYDNNYDASGTFESRIFDTSNPLTQWDVIYWSEILPDGAEVTLATRTGNTSSPDGSWSGWSSEYTDDYGSIITSDDNTRYIQYRITLTRATNPAQSPELSEVGILYDLVTNKNLNDIDIIALDDAWAVGDDGVFIKYDGTAWSMHTDLSISEEVYAVDHVSSTDVWACGSSGKIYHYDGSTWSEDTDIGGTNLNDIYMLASNDGWIVGDGGEIYHYDGSSWSQFTDTGNRNLYSLDMVSDSDGWVCAEHGEIYHYDGSSWSQFTDTGNETWYSVNMVSNSDGWLVGSNGEIYHYDGSSWSQFTDTGNETWYSVNMVSNSDGWLVGSNGEIYHYDGSSWTLHANSEQTLNAVEMFSSSDGWAVGTNGQLRQYQAGGGYQTAGTLLSSAYDMGADSYLNNLVWDEYIPTCSPTCEIKLQLRSAPDNSGTPGTWTDWYGTSGSGDYFTNHEGENIPEDLSPNQWVQYRVELIGDGEDTPVLSDININYQ